EQVSAMVPARRRAARLLRDVPEVAIRHAIAGEDWDFAVQLLSTHCVPLIVDHPLLVKKVLAALPPEAFVDHPALFTARDVLFQFRTDEISPEGFEWPDDGVELSDEALRHVVGLGI